MEKIPNQFSVEVFGELSTFSPTLSASRVRIFYKGVNRNATYISEEFAKKLLSTLSYAPIKGIYETEDNDFSDHGNERTEGQIYGVVPENPDIKWEWHVDEDGVNREYACANVLLFTGIYPEAHKIPGKAQSMELHIPSIKGNWEEIEGQKVYCFKEASFLGLQILGKEVEPCFEGSEFFSLYTSLKKLVKEIEGGKRMVKFKISDSEKYEMIFNKLNPNYNEAGGWEISWVICDIYESYAVCYSYETGTYSRCAYTKDDSSDEVTLGVMTKCYIIDVTEEEYKSLNVLKKANDNNFKKVDEIFVSANTKIDQITAELKSKVEEFSSKEQELINKEQEIAAKELELTTQNENYVALQTKLDELAVEKDTIITEKETVITDLEAFKKNIEIAEKEAIISRYVTVLDEETVLPFKEKIEDFTVDALSKELAFLAIEKNPNLFSEGPINGIPKRNNTSLNLSGAAKIIMKHKKLKTEE